MNRYFILGEQGTCLHFIGCLIRLLYDKNYYNNKITTNKVGIYDTAFGPHAFFEAFRNSHYQFSQYPEETCAIGALNCLNEIFTSGYVIDRSYPVEYNIIPAHYGNQKTINHILETFEKPKIIFIKYENDDLNQIAINIFNKVYWPSLFNFNGFSIRRIKSASELYKNLLNFDISNKQHILNLTPPQLQYLCNKIAEVELTDKKFMVTPEKNDNVIVINFGEMKNVDKLLDRLVEFTNQPITEELYKFANNFLYDQPTIDSTLDLIKKQRLLYLIKNHRLP